MSNQHNLEFEPIPSLNYRYEINCYGVVRNARTKKVLTPRKNYNCFYFRFKLGNSQQAHRSLNQLLWEVFGDVPETKNEPIPVTVRNNLYRKAFKSQRACSMWLASILNKSASYIRARLSCRCPVISDFHITYHLPEQRTFRTPARIIGDHYLTYTNKRLPQINHSAI